jgi:hypothetical protein
VSIHVICYTLIAQRQFRAGCALLAGQSREDSIAFVSGPEICLPLLICWLQYEDGCWNGDLLGKSYLSLMYFLMLGGTARQSWSNFELLFVHRFSLQVWCPVTCTCQWQL